jgi:hypothetical protein
MEAGMGGKRDWKSRLQEKGGEAAGRGGMGEGREFGTAALPLGDCSVDRRVITSLRR